MAKTQQTISKILSRIVKKRKGIHAKNKTSKNKGSKLYKKRYRGQGK